MAAAPIDEKRSHSRLFLVFATFLGLILVFVLVFVAGFLALHFVFHLILHLLLHFLHRLFLFLHLFLHFGSVSSALIFWRGLGAFAASEDAKAQSQNQHGQRPAAYEANHS